MISIVKESLDDVLRRKSYDRPRAKPRPIRSEQKRLTNRDIAEEPDEDIGFGD